MARGKQLDNQTVYNIMTSYMITKNFNKSAKELNLPEATVRQTYNKNKDKLEFTELHEQKKDEFTKKTSIIIDKALELLDRRITTALEHEEHLDELIDEIYAKDNSEMKQDEKARLVKKLRQLQVQSISEITTATGTLFDKRALAKGESTSNERVSIQIETNYE